MTPPASAPGPHEAGVIDADARGLVVGREGIGLAAPGGFDWIGAPLRGFYVARHTRFTCLVELEGQPVLAHLPNTGRLVDLLLPGAPVVLERRRDGVGTHHDLLLIGSPRFPGGGSIWVSVDTRLPNRLVRWVVESGLWRPWQGEVSLRPEPRVGEGRLDLEVVEGYQRHFVEAKSVNLLDRTGISRFPDDPTLRGSRHLRSLVELKRQGYGAWAVFVVVREDAVAFSPYAERDPLLTEELLRAREAGVEIVALQFASGPQVRYLGTLDVLLPPPPFPGLWPIR